MNHTWTWDEINTDWLSGAQIAMSPDEVVTAFNRAEQILGRDWIETSRLHSGIQVRGTSPTLRVVTMGHMLASLDGVRGREDLIEKLRKGDISAFAELAALHLLRAAVPTATLELEPVVDVGGHERKPDFRVQQADDPWTYVEVTRPNTSHAQRDIEAIMQRLTSMLKPIKKPFGLEIFLNRAPTEEELAQLEKRVSAFCLLDDIQSEDIPNLGKLFLNQHPPGQVVLDDHGEEPVPRLGRIDTISGPDEPHRHIAVRLAFADERAVDVLEAEAKQLPKGAPGFIMIQTSRTHGAFKVWEPLIRRRFQPTINTRVSAVCLFAPSQTQTPEGAAPLTQVKLLINPHARNPLPDSIGAALSKFDKQ
jgi:hypothetical protein